MQEKRTKMFINIFTVSRSNPTEAERLFSTLSLFTRFDHLLVQFPVEQFVRFRRDIAGDRGGIVLTIYQGRL